MDQQEGGTRRPDGRKGQRHRSKKTNPAVLRPAGGPRTTEEIRKEGRDEGLKNNNNKTKQNWNIG